MPRPQAGEVQTVLGAIAAERMGVTLREQCAVARIVTSGERAAGVALADGTQVHADTVVLAAGAWSRRIEGLPTEARPPVRPVKGQTIALRMDTAAPLINHVVWAPAATPLLEGRAG